MSNEDKIKLTIKDLLWVTNDGTQAGVGVKAGQSQADPTEVVSEDFQTKQIDRLVEAIALTLPNGGLTQGTLAL